LRKVEPSKPEFRQVSASLKTQGRGAKPGILEPEKSANF
jgi:hypothetical protein